MSRHGAATHLYNTPLVRPCGGREARGYPCVSCIYHQDMIFQPQSPTEWIQIYVSTSRRIIINDGLMPRLIVIGDFNQNTRLSISFEMIWQLCAWQDNSTYNSLPDTMISVPENHERVLWSMSSLRHSDRSRASNNSRLDQTTINKLESFNYWTLS
jgi:hypothetical protein